MITTNLKNHMLGAYSSNLTRIVLNGTELVTEFATVIDNGILVVQFTVPANITSISKIEFFDEGDLLSERQLYVPISSDTLFKYKVEVV